MASKGDSIISQITNASIALNGRLLENHPFRVAGILQTREEKLLIYAPLTGQIAWFHIDFQLSGYRRSLYNPSLIESVLSVHDRVCMISYSKFLPDSQLLL